MILLFCLFVSSQEKPNFISDIRIHNTILSTEINLELKKNYNSSNQNELKYFPMSEGNTCIAEPNLEVLPLMWFC